MFRKPTVIEAVLQKLISVPTCHCLIHLPQETSLFYIWCIFSLSALHSSLNKMFCWLERKLFDPFNGHLSSDKLHLHSVKSLKFPFFSPVANWRRSPLITSFLTGHVTRSSPWIYTLYIHDPLRNWMYLWIFYSSVKSLRSHNVHLSVSSAQSSFKLNFSGLFGQSEPKIYSVLSHFNSFCLALKTMN